MTTKTKETWKPIPGWGDRYDVSDAGRVRSLVKTGNYAPVRRVVPKVLRPKTDRDRYQLVNLCVDYQHMMLRVHRLVLLAFVGPCPKGMTASHLNGDPSDNRLVNLAWEDRKSNAAHQLEHGTRNKGSHNGLAKLNEARVKEIKVALMCGEPHSSIAERHAVCRETVSQIAQGKTWKHVT